MPLNQTPAPNPSISVMAEDRLFGEEALSDVLGGLIDTGVVLQADLTLTLAGVDLVYVGLRAVICAADAEPARAALGCGEIGQ
ncbi:MAG: gas vesicle protein [Pseudomonadota bacterium]